VIRVSRDDGDRNAGDWWDLVEAACLPGRVCIFTRAGRPMTATDPVMVAARDAWDSRYGNRFDPFDRADADMGMGSLRALAVEAAREALAPIRALHREFRPTFQCEECGADWPCDTAKLVYAEGDL